MQWTCQHYFEVYQKNFLNKFNVCLFWCICHKSIGKSIWDFGVDVKDLYVTVSFKIKKWCLLKKYFFWNKHQFFIDIFHNLILIHCPTFYNIAVNYKFFLCDRATKSLILFDASGFTRLLQEIFLTFHNSVVQYFTFWGTNKWYKV